jgi:hypothetical protein
MSGSGLIVLLALVAGATIWFTRARARTRRREATLARLAPLISGTVSSKDQRLRGTYQGHVIEAWTSKHDPTPSSFSGDSSPVEVTVFQLRVGGVPGHESWACRPQPRLNPFASPEYRFDWSYGGIGPLAGLLGKVADLPEHDPGLEQRLREAGLLETIDGFGRGSSAFLPRAQYTPALNVQHPALPAAIGPAREQVGELFYEVELNRADPSPELFAELLDRALQIVAINAKANPVTPRPT